VIEIFMMPAVSLHRFIQMLLEDACLMYSDYTVSILYFSFQFFECRICNWFL